MANERNSTGHETGSTTNRLEQKSTVPNDLPDSPRDRDELRSDKTTIDLPDVKDIPGQEFVHVPKLGEMADVTVSSADEEGVGIEGLDDEDDNDRDTDFDVRPDEKEALRDTTYMPTRDEDNLRQARMDNVDFEGEPLNEASFGTGQSLTGNDLDTGDIYEEANADSIEGSDEENKDFSVDDTDTEEPSENRTGA